VLNIHQHSTGGSLLLNNARWPSGVVQPNPGMFIGVSALNELEYFPFVLGFNNSNTLTNIDLIGLYPSAVTGQSVVAPNVIYSCVGTHLWRALGQTSAPPPGSAPETLVIRLQDNGSAQMTGSDYANWSVSNPAEVESVDAYWDSYSGMLNLVTPGAYEVKIKTLMYPMPSYWGPGTLPIDNFRYGTVVSNALAGFERSQYFRGVDNWPTATALGSNTWWEDTFVVNATSPNWPSSIYAYAESVSYPLTDIGFKLQVCVTRLLGTIPQQV
jgi:hypothetical protein